MITALIIFPIVVALLIAALPAKAEFMARFVGALTAILMAANAIAARVQGDETHQWLQRPFTAALHLGLGTGPSFWLTLLTAVIALSAILATRVARVPQFVALVLVLEGTMTGVFVARDLLLFAFFWDLMLLPVFFVLTGWSGHATAAWRYLIYNVIGGLTLLLATAAFGIVYGTTDVIGQVNFHPLGPVWGMWIFAGIAFAFLVKTPAWPLHTWMPETYAELPPPMAALVSGVQSKAGLYGLLVIGMPLFAEQFAQAAPLFNVLGIIGLLYGGYMALVQRDMKRVIAYSSLSHLGLILVALASRNPMAISGSVLYMVGHGLFSAALFLVAGYVEAREDTRLIDRLGGLGKRNPRLAGAFIFSALAALGLPGLVGFAGELIIIAGLYRSGETLESYLALIPIVLAAAYMLRLFQGVMQGPEVDDLPQRPDLRPLEILALTPLIVSIVALGVAPAAVLSTAVAIAHPVPVEVDVIPHRIAAARIITAKAPAVPVAVRGVQR
jgi:NADH-quinone oxidoreductase subunit M